MRVQFDGDTYEPSQDYHRMRTLLDRVSLFMNDCEWHTLAEIHEACGGSESGCSARLRDLRKPKFGSHHIVRVRRFGGVFAYRSVFPIIGES